MCCGNNRAKLAQMKAPSPGPGTVQRSDAFGRASRNMVAYFEYIGKMAVTVIGPVTGLKYRFPASGSRLAVDLRDRQYVAKIPQLQEIRHL